MALRPGSLLEISSHFIPLPRSSIISASSSGDHLLCFFAGDSAECGPMLRFAAIELVARGGMVLGLECKVPGGGAEGGGIPAAMGRNWWAPYAAAGAAGGKCARAVVGGCSDEAGEKGCG